MALPHTSSSKRPRLDLSIKSASFRDLGGEGVKKSEFIQSSQSSFEDHTQILEQFRLIRESDENEEHFNEDTRRRKSYTRENKLVAINYATTSGKTQKDETLKHITKYEATKNLEIDLAMLRKGLKTSSKIKSMNTEVRKHKSLNTNCQESKLERQLIELFKKKRQIEMKIDKRGIIRQAKHIYAELYSHRVIRKTSKRDEYLGFKFSIEGFNNFKNRVDIASRAVIKKSQTVFENLRLTIERGLQFNRRNSQLLLDQISQHEEGRYRLCDIENMNQTLIAYEFLNEHTYVSNPGRSEVGEDYDYYGSRLKISKMRRKVNIEKNLFI